MAICAHCGSEFHARRAGHRFCKPWCRHQGERKPHDPPPINPEVVDRLFDPRRDPKDTVEPDDFFYPPNADPAWRALYAHETVEGRRRWHENLRDQGRI